MRSPTKSNQGAGRIDWVPCSVRHSCEGESKLGHISRLDICRVWKRVTAVAYRSSDTWFCWEADRPPPPSPVQGVEV